VARVALDRREALLRAHRHRLRLEDLEECLGQATLELVENARREDRFVSARHVANSLEQRLLSRISDHHRATSGGRSPRQIAVEDLLELGDPDSGAVEVADGRAEVERIVMARLRLGRMGEALKELSHDQQLVLSCQLSGRMDRAELCRSSGWSTEKYNSVMRRARQRLRARVDD
jgi:DNA-directed RNA polymerase specialized sigma24 family protein